MNTAYQHGTCDVVPHWPVEILLYHSVWQNGQSSQLADLHASCVQMVQILRFPSLFAC